MKTIASKPKLVLSEREIPFGSYQGTWGGYRAKFFVHGYWYEVETFDGIRTPAAPCVVEVSGEGISVEALG